MQDIGVDDAIRALRQQLSASVLEGRDQELRFELGPIELEFQVTVTKDANARGGVRFWLITAEGGASAARSIMHTVRLRLMPVTAENRPVLTADEPVAEFPR